MTVTVAWRRLAALEQEAVWWFGLAAGSPQFTALATTHLAEHRTARDHILATLATRTIAIPAAAPAYASPGRAAAADLQAHSRDLLDRLAGNCLELLGILPFDDDLRRFLVERVTTVALQARAWGADLDPFPGLR